MDAYQARAAADGVDALGFYMAPLAYAQMQVVEQAITATRGLDDEQLAEYTRHSTFQTVVGDVVFGPHGEWAQSRVLQVQFQSIKMPRHRAIQGCANPGRRRARRLGVGRADLPLCTRAMRSES